MILFPSFFILRNFADVSSQLSLVDRDVTGDRESDWPFGSWSAR